MVRNQVDLDFIYLSFNSRADFNKYLHMQCEIDKIIYPKWAYQWINIKNTFTEFYSIKSGRKLKETFLHFLISCSFSVKKGIRDMLDKLGLSFRGNLHSGLDDATNIGRIAIELIKVNKYIKKSF